MKQLNPVQVEQLKEIGAYLRQRRQEQSISTEEVAAKTCIRVPLLQALEEGQSEQLPEPVFVQGFIRRYAEALKLNGEELAKTFYTTSPTPTSILPVKAEEVDAGADTAKVSPKNIQPYIVYALLVAAAAGGLIYLANNGQFSRPELPTQDSSATGVEPTETEAESEADVPVVPEAESDTPAPEEVEANEASTALSSPVEVSISLEDTSWLRVTVDGENEFEGILNQGERRRFSADNQLTIRTGNAGAVLVSVDQQQPEPLGNVGEVKEVTFPSPQ